MKRLMKFMAFVLIGTALVACQFENPSSSSSSVVSSTSQSTETSSSSSVDIPAPLITVDPASVQIYAGQAYDLTEGVVAVDITDGTLTSSVTIDQGNYDNNTPGTYTITYSVKNSGNKTSSSTRTIEVLEKITAVEIDGKQYPTLVNPRLNAQYTSQVFGYELNKVTVFEKSYFEWMQANMPERLGIYYSIVAVTNGDGTVREIRNAIGGHIKDYGPENGGVMQKNATTWCPSPSAPTNEAAPYCGLYEGAQLANINDLEDGAYVVVFPNGGLGLDGKANSEGSPRFFGDMTLLKDASTIINQVKIEVVNVNDEDKFDATNTRPVIKLAKNSEKKEIYIGSLVPDLLEDVTVVDDKDTNLEITTNIYYYANQGAFGAQVDAISTEVANIYTVEYVVTDSDNNVDKMYRQYTIRKAPDSIQINSMLYEAMFDLPDFFKQCGEGGTSGTSCYNTKYATKSALFVLDRDFVVTQKAVLGQYLSKISSTFVVVIDSEGNIKTARNILGDYWLPIPAEGALPNQNEFGWLPADITVFNRNSDMLTNIDAVSASGDLIIIAPSGGAANTAGIKPRDYLSYHLFANWATYPVTPASGTTDGWRGTGKINLTDVKITVNKVSVAPDPIQLDTPTNIVLNGSVLTWDKVPNALKYEIIFKDVTHDPIIVTTNTYDLNDALLGVGNYQVTVKAIGDDLYYLDSNSSVETAYTQAIRTLPTVTGVEVTEAKIISWIDVANATQYKVIIGKYVDGVLTTTQEFLTTEALYDASALTDGSYKVTVLAMGDGVEYENGLASAEVEFAVGLQQLATVVNPTLTDGTLTWDVVENATSYVVTAKNKINNALLTTEVTTNTATLAFVNVVGEYDVYVEAKAANYKTSEPSISVFHRNLVGQNKIMVNGVVTGFDVDYHDITDLKANWATGTMLASKKTIYVIEDISTPENIAVLDSWTSNAAKNTVTMIVDSTGHVKLVRTILGNFQWTPSTGWTVSTEYASGTNHFINMSQYIGEGDILVVATNGGSTVGAPASPRDYLSYFFQGTWAGFNAESVIALGGESWRQTTTTNFIDNTNTIMYFGKAN